MFSGIKNMLHMSQAAAVVQNLLEDQQRNGFLGGDVAQMASHLVAVIWTQDPDWFNGKRGPRPHKVSVAAVALAQGIRNSIGDRSVWLAYLTSLGTILSDVTANRYSYALSGTDLRLLELAEKDYLSHDNDLMASERPAVPAIPVDEVTSMAAKVQPRSLSAAEQEMKDRRDKLLTRINAFPSR